METEIKTIKQELGVEAHETLKLEKNSKGYNWEIKLFINECFSDEDNLKRIDKIIESLKSKYTQEVK